MRTIRILARLTALLAIISITDCAFARSNVLGVEGSFSPDGQKVIALTFDDGPGPYTDLLLDALLERNARATFFLFGQKVTDETAPLLLRMRDEGHCIGSHTYSHARLTELSNGDISIELERADNVIRAVTGSSPALVRPPFGSYDDRVVNACARPVILWSLDTRDWQLHEPASVCHNILASVKDGDVVLLHELEKSSLDGVIAAIDVLMDEGYSFVTVPELFGMRGIELLPGNYYHDACSISGNILPLEGGEGQNATG